MAAKLKKRALAEYGSQVIAEEKKQEAPKRLKLSIRQSVSVEHESTPTLNIETSTPEKVILTELMKFGRALNLSTTDNLNSAVRRIEECLQKVKENSLKHKLIIIYARIIASGKISETAEKLESIMEQMRAETSNKVVTAWLQAAAIISQKVSLEPGCREKLVEAAKVCLLGSANPVVHTNALALLATLVTPDTGQLNSAVSKLVGSYSLSQDARVRTAAFHSLITIHGQGVALDVSLYPVLCSALADDYEGVRCEVLRIMAILAASEPEHQVAIDSASGYNRLVDDVFSRICQAINDVQESVRCLAAQTIGSMTKVSQTFLEQTLDKKLMSNMRLKKSSHERQAGLISSGEWSSGKKWADDAPKEELSSDAVNLVSLGSCGAFVHGLEDECFSVRVAAVDSLTRLAVENSSLASIALDFLVDMFNDEIEQVRLKAIESLTAISKHIQLQVHQLDIILSALDDYSTLLREKLHLMLQSCTIATKDGLKSVINKLMTNLKKYPQDKRSILVTFKHLGGNHPDLTLPLIFSLLDIHPFFDTPQPDIDDPGYLCTLVLVLNAAQHCPTLPPLLDNHTKRHHAYLQDTFPDLIPGLKVEPRECIPERTVGFLAAVLRRVGMSRRMSSASQISVLSASCRELERVASIQPSISDPATFAKLYIESQIIYERIVRSHAWSHHSAQPGPALSDNILKLERICQKLNFMFLNLNRENQIQIRVLKLKLLGIALVSVVSHSNKSALGQTNDFIKEFNAVLMELTDEEMNNQAFLSDFHALQLSEAKPGLIVSKLKPLLLKHPPDCLATVSLETKQAKALIREPTGGSETPLRCTAGLVLGIHMDAEITNLPDPASLRICIVSGDQVTHLSLPKRGDLVPVREGCYRLLTTALLSHQVWSEALDVEVSVVVELEEGRTRSEGKENTTAKKKRRQNFVPLCKPVKVSVLPKAVRRGI